MGCFVVIVVDEVEVACIDLYRTSDTSVVNFTGVPKSLHKIPSNSSTFRIYTSSLDNEVVAPNPLKLPHFFDTLLCLGNELVTPNPLKFLNFLDTLLYLGIHLDTPNPLKFLNCLDTLLYFGNQLVSVLWRGPLDTLCNGIMTSMFTIEDLLWT